MSNPNVQGFDPGGVVDIVDNRDYQLDEVAAAPVAFDWDTGFDIEDSLRIALNNPTFKLTVKDQEQSFSCGGQAWAYLAEVLEALKTGTYETRSAKYVYAQTHVPPGGSRGRDNADIFVNQGVARETVLPSVPATEAFLTRSQDITDPVRINAKLARSFVYAQAPLNINSAAMAIRDHGGVVLGIDGANNGTWGSEFPKPPSNTEWRHWVYFGKAKKIGGIKHIACLNSWGTNVGDNGWQWIAEQYFNSGHVWSAWTHVLMPPITPPVEPPVQHVFNINLAYRDRSDEVKHLQTKLQKLGFFPANVNPTTFYGLITASSVLKFQVAHNVSTMANLIALQGKAFGPLSRAKINTL